MAKTGSISSSELRDRGHWEALPVIEEDAIYPRDAEHRYRIYARHGEEIEVLACAGSPEALGVAIVQLDEDERDRGRRLVDLGAIGVLDAVAGRWLIMPWHRPEIPTTVGPSPEELLGRLYAAGWRIADDGDPYRPDEDR
jgi:hypothetical protein